MKHIDFEYQAGVVDAERDIATDQPKLRYGARGKWGESLAEALRVKFGVELIVASCLTDAGSSSFDAGYNATVEAYVDRMHGNGSLAAVLAEIQRRRQMDYHAWAAEMHKECEGF